MFAKKPVVNKVTPVAQQICAYLARKIDADGGTTVIYWAVGENGTILESDDGGEHWNARNSGTPNNLYSIFGTSDGKHLWAVGDNGTILEAAIP